MTRSPRERAEASRRSTRQPIRRRPVARFAPALDVGEHLFDGRRRLDGDGFELDGRRRAFGQRHFAAEANEPSRAPTPQRILRRPQTAKLRQARFKLIAERRGATGRQ